MERSKSHLQGGEPTLPEGLQPVSWLHGRWMTEHGQGHYPTIKDFHYHEDMEFVCVGQPMFNYTSTTRHPQKQTPMHQERGFLRIKPGTDNIALILSHNFGLTSVEEGRVVLDQNTKELRLKTTDITRISFAKPPQVKSIQRVLKLIDDDTLEQTLSMETDRTPMTEHLKAVYKRVKQIG